MVLADAARRRRVWGDADLGARVSSGVTRAPFAVCCMGWALCRARHTRLLL